MCTRNPGNWYNFSTTKGVNFGFGASIGAQVMGLATAGVSGSISKNQPKTSARLSSQTRLDSSLATTKKTCLTLARIACHC